MDWKDLVKVTNNSIEVLLEGFRKSSAFFFTENDISGYLYYILQKDLRYFPVNDKEGKAHSLVHMGFPAPFRCDLNEGQFKIKEDTETTPSGGLYQRGHYDLVVLNPEFIKNNDFKTIKAQDYQRFKGEALKHADKNSPLIVYGLGFMCLQDSFLNSKGKLDEEGAAAFAEKVIQGADKLVASREIMDSGFIKNIGMIVLVKDKENDFLKEKLSRPEIILRFAD